MKYEYDSTDAYKNLKAAESYVREANDTAYGTEGSVVYAINGLTFAIAACACHICGIAQVLAIMHNEDEGR